MTKRSRTTILLVCAALCIACRSESVFTPEPTPAPSFTTLEVRPTIWELSSLVPWDSVQLSIAAWDQRGVAMAGAGAPTYSSSAPEIAVVSSSGVVRPAAPGTALITASLALGGVTRTGSMTIKVHGPDEWRLLGIYQFTAPVTSFDESLKGVMADARYTAVLELELEQATGRLHGAFKDLRFVTATEEHKVRAGVNFGLSSNGEISMWTDSFMYDEDLGVFDMRGVILKSGDIGGTFECCVTGHVRGTFTATRVSQ